MTDIDTTADRSKEPEGTSPKAEAGRASPVQYVRAYPGRAMDILRHPRKFFDQMPSEGGFIEPSIFLLLSAGIYALLQAIAKFNPALLILTTLTSVVSVVLASGIIWFACKFFGGKGTFESTFRVLSYSKATLLFAWVTLGPVPIGGLASIGYCIYLNILGLEEVQAVGFWKILTMVLVLNIAAIFLRRMVGL